MGLLVHYERCVHPRAVEASCRACADACPAAAISLGGEKRSVSVDLSRCTSCGLCQAACPTEAFEGAFDAGAFVAAAPAPVRCGEGGLACVGALAAEDLVTLALKRGGLTVEARACDAGATGHPLAEDRVNQANAWLLAQGASQRVTWIGAPSPAKTPPPPPPEPDEAPAAGRRALLRFVLPLPAPAEERRFLRQPPFLSKELLRSARLTDRRKRLLGALPAGEQAPTSMVAATAIGFTSAKQLDVDTCTGCLRCTAGCPTGALSTPRWADRLSFDASRCVKCHLCHDVCTPGALTLAATLDPTELLELAPKVLGRFELKRCGDCGATFKPRGEQPICATCAGLEDEARELTGAPR